MKILDIRRHSMRQKPGQHLSQDGVELARRVGAHLGPYEAVLTSNLARAIETAVAMGFALNDISEEIGLYPEALSEQLEWPASLEKIDHRLSLFPEHQILASKQVASWKSILPKIPEKGCGLIITYGTLLEIGAIFLLREIGRPIEGPAFAYCEGLRVHVNGETVEAVEFMRLPEGQRMLSN
ncbi:hypothetical protein [Bosea minatitlanensis]|uniref:Histidine phosphatase family protein n=1 Tax=Bosea minatitlanensis TaxID=128782 RepID=A0ABW0F758_9HYPH|nr:hypothetical protein [Bosea minatitlanensis]MCT4493234.1 hypothetical protein [Bosea minatitlanensis]